MQLVWESQSCYVQRHRATERERGRGRASTGHLRVITSGSHVQLSALTNSIIKSDGDTDVIFHSNVAQLHPRWAPCQAEPSRVQRALSPEGVVVGVAQRPHPPTLCPSKSITSRKAVYTGGVTIKHLIKTRKKFTDLLRRTASAIFPSSSYYCYYDCYYEIIVILIAQVERSGLLCR